MATHYVYNMHMETQQHIHNTSIFYNSALHPSGVAKSSTSIGWDKGGKVTTAGWQVTLCDPIWHVISWSGVVILIANCYIHVYFTLLYWKCHTFQQKKLTQCTRFHSLLKIVICQVKYVNMSGQCVQLILQSRSQWVPVKCKHFISSLWITTEQT